MKIIGILLALSTLCLSGLQAATLIPQANTLVYYRFNETSGSATTALDSSGKGRHATYGSTTGRGNSYPSRPGMGNAVDINSGATGRVSYTDTTPYADSDLYNFAQQSFTVDFYLKLDVGSVDGNGKLTFNTASLLTIQGNNANTTYDFSITMWGTYSSAFNGGFSLGSSTNANKVNFLGGPTNLNLTWQADAWYHIAFSYNEDDGKYSFYRSTAGSDTLSLVSTTGSLGAIAQSTATVNRSLLIGSRGASTVINAFPGMLDDVRLAVIPEPGSLSLVIAALGGIAGLRVIRRWKIS